MSAAAPVSAVTSPSAHPGVIFIKKFAEFLCDQKGGLTDSFLDSVHQQIVQLEAANAALRARELQLLQESRDAEAHIAATAPKLAAEVQKYEALVADANHLQEAIAAVGKSVLSPQGILHVG